MKYIQKSSDLKGKSSDLKGENSDLACGEKIWYCTKLYMRGEIHSRREGFVGEREGLFEWRRREVRKKRDKGGAATGFCCRSRRRWLFSRWRREVEKKRREEERKGGRGFHSKGIRERGDMVSMIRKKEEKAPKAVVIHAWEKDGEIGFSIEERRKMIVNGTISERLNTDMFSQSRSWTLGSF